MLDQTILFVMTETALARDTHVNSEIELSGAVPFNLARFGGHTKKNDTSDWQTTVQPQSTCLIIPNVTSL